MRVVLCTVLILLSGCRILVVSSEGGTVVSRSGLNDCRNGAACSLEVTPGRRFSDSFAAVAEPGYRFAGWQSGPRHLCGSSL